MKKLLFAAALLTTVNVAMAQSKTNTTTSTTSTTSSTTVASPAMSVDQINRKMYDDLELREGQYAKVRSLNQTKFDRMNDINTVYSSDPQTKQEKINALNAEMDREYQSVLTPDQYDAYLTAEGRNTNAVSPTQSINNNMNSDVNLPSGTVKSGNTIQNITKTTTTTQSNTSNGTMHSQGSTQMKAKSTDAKVKVDSDGTKMKTDNAKYKDENDKLKMQNSSDNSKLKVQGDKMKAEDKNSKMKVEENKVKIKSRD